MSLDEVTVVNRSGNHSTFVVRDSELAASEVTPWCLWTRTFKKKNNLDIAKRPYLYINTQHSIHAFLLQPFQLNPPDLVVVTVF